MLAMKRKLGKPREPHRHGAVSEKGEPGKAGSIYPKSPLRDARATLPKVYDLILRFDSKEAVLRSDS
jgi:hypothetical protein